jgi:hypothetical protein
LLALLSRQRTADAVKKARACIATRTETNVGPLPSAEAPNQSVSCANAGPMFSVALKRENCESRRVKCPFAAHAQSAYKLATSRTGFDEETAENVDDHSHFTIFGPFLKPLKTEGFHFKNSNDFEPLFSLLFSLWAFLKFKK